jgi:hypothetical protein
VLAGPHRRRPARVVQPLGVALRAGPQIDAVDEAGLGDEVGVAAVDERASVLCGLPVMATTADANSRSGPISRRSSSLSRISTKVALLFSISSLTCCGVRFSICCFASFTRSVADLLAIM